MSVSNSADRRVWRELNAMSDYTIRLTTTLNEPDQPKLRGLRSAHIKVGIPTITVSQRRRPPFVSVAASFGGGLDLASRLSKKDHTLILTTTSCDTFIIFRPSGLFDRP